MSGAGTETSSVLLALARSLALYGAIAAANAGRRAAAVVAGYLVVAALFAASLCFLTFSGYRAISLALGSIYASLIVGCVFLVAGLIVALILQVRRH
jgi:hypothetical protein